MIRLAFLLSGMLLLLSCGPTSGPSAKTDTAIVVDSIKDTAGLPVQEVQKKATCSEAKESSKGESSWIY